MKNTGSQDKNLHEPASEGQRVWDYRNEAVRKAMNRYPNRVPKFKVNEESIELWKQGAGCDYYKPQHGYHHGQGYIVVADLETFEIFLVPSWNDGDDKERVNKYGVPFKTTRTFTDKNGQKKVVEKKWLNVSRAKLGGNSGDAHVNAVIQLGLADRGGVQGRLVGLGIWKGKKHLISEMRNRSYSQNHFAMEFRKDFVDICRRLFSEFTASTREKSLPTELTDAIVRALTEQLPSEKETRYRTVLKDRAKHDFPTPFHVAASKGELPKLKELLDAGMNVNEFGLRNYTSFPEPQTALRMAIFGGHWEAAKYLIERGADVNLGFLKPDDATKSPLTLAIDTYESPIDLIELLIAKGAHVEELETYRTFALEGDNNLDEPDIDAIYRLYPRTYSTYPLYAAVKVGREDIIKLLRDKGMRLFDKPGIIKFAVENGDDQIIQYLIEQEHILLQDKGFNAKEMAGKYSTDMDWSYVVENNMVNTAKLAIHIWKKVGLLTESHIQHRLETCKEKDNKDIAELLNQALQDLLKPRVFPPKPKGARPAHLAPPKSKEKPKAHPALVSGLRVQALRAKFESPQPKPTPKSPKPPSSTSHRK